MAIGQDHIVINIEDEEDNQNLCCNHPSGTYEVEHFGPGPEAEESAQKWDECKKNPGHPSFIPFKNFCLDDIPSEGCSHKRNIMLRIVKLIAELTVRIRVKQSRQDSHAGTGRVVNVFPGYGPSPTGRKRCWYRVHIMTAEHVVSDLQQARSAKADLYYDDDNSLGDGRLKTMSGFNFVDKAEDGLDCSVLECVLDDTETAARLNDGLNELARVTYELSSLPPDQSSRELVVVVSHPHGQPKMVTVGKLKDRDLVTSPSYRNGQTPWVHGNIMYDTDTCHGSSGANVIWFGMSPSRLNGGVTAYLQRCARNPRLIMWELEHSHSKVFDTQALLSSFDDLVCFFLLLFYLISVRLISRFGFSWVLKLHMSCIEEVSYLFLTEIYNVLASMPILYLVPYLATTRLLRLCLMTEAKCIPKFLKARMTGMLFAVILLLFLSIIRDVDIHKDMLSLLSPFTNAWMVFLTVSMSDKLCSMKPHQSGILIRYIIVSLYLIRFSVLFFLFVKDLRNVYFGILNELENLWCLVANLLLTLAAVSKSNCFIIVRSCFNRRPARVLSFVHSQSGETRDQNKSHVGVWFQNSPTRKCSATETKWKVKHV